MDKKSVAEALRALAGNDESRSETARLRDVFDEVEEALSAGVSRDSILATLHEGGFKMTKKSFESALYRLRKQKENGGSSKKAMRVHGTKVGDSSREFSAAAPQITPKESVDDSDSEGVFLTEREKRDRKASQYVTQAETQNSIVSKILKDKKP